MSELLETVRTMITRARKGTLTYGEAVELHEKCGFTFVKDGNKFKVGVE